MSTLSATLERSGHGTRGIVAAIIIGVLMAVLVLLPRQPHGVLAGLLSLVALITLVNRRFGLYLVAPAIALSPEIPILSVAMRVEDIIMVFLVMAWVARLLVFQDRRGTSLDRIMLFYGAIGLVATLWGGAIGTANFSTTHQLFSSPFHLLKRFEFILLFFILTDSLVSPQDVRRYTYLFMVSLVALNIFSLFQFLSNKYLALAPAGAPIHEPGLAAMLNIALALGLWPAVRKAGRVFLAVLILFSMAVLPLGLGRNFVATTALVTTYVGIFQQRWVLTLIPVPYLFMRYVFPNHIIERYLTLRYAFSPDLSGLETQGAALIYRTIAPGFYSLLALGYSPLVGFGLASRPLGFIDSEYATQLFYTGIIGLAIFFMLGARLFRMAAEARRLASDPLAAGLARGFQLCLACYAIWSLFSPSASAARSGGFLFVIVALLAVLHRSTVKPCASQ